MTPQPDHHDHRDHDNRDHEPPPGAARGNGGDRSRDHSGDCRPTETAHPARRAGSRGLLLVPGQHPRRATAKLLGITNHAREEAIGLRVADARHHVHVQGVTGVGKSTWLANHVLGEAQAGRGVVLLDCQGDLARNVLERLPADCGNRLVVLDPDETQAPAAWNVLAPPRTTPPRLVRDDPRPGEPIAETRLGGVSAGVRPVPVLGVTGGHGQVEVAGREWVAESVVGVFRRLYAAWWGPRMDDVLRAACLTLVRRPGSTLAEVVTLLTRADFRRHVLDRYGEPEGLEGFWASYDALTTGQQHQVCGPVLSRLRSVLAREFARHLLAAPESTFDLGEVLDGGILIARLPKGQIGEAASQLVGSLLLSGLWAAATRRSALPPEQRLDATIVVDECHNFLNLPIGADDALAEARGYAVSLVLAHQHRTQLPPDVRDAVDANARNKVFFTVSPDDATRLVRHVTPYFADRDLSRRPAFEITARIVNRGHDAAPFTLASLPLPPAVPGRSDMLRAAARVRCGLSIAARNRPRQRSIDAPDSGGQRGAQSHAHRPHAQAHTYEGARDCAPPPPEFAQVRTEKEES